MYTNQFVWLCSYRNHLVLCPTRNKLINTHWDYINTAYIKLVLRYSISCQFRYFKCLKLRLLNQVVSLFTWYNNILYNIP